MSRKSDAAPAPAPDPVEAGAAYLDTLLASHDMTKVGETARLLPPCGLRLQTPAERLLFGTNVLLMGRTYLLMGPSYSCKSAFLYDRYRTVYHANGRPHSGRYVHAECEGKDSPELRLSLVRPQPGFAEGQWSRQCQTMDAWMKLLWNLRDFVISTCEKPLPGSKGPKKKVLGRSLPVYFGVDSLVGAAAEETIKNVTDHDGAPTKMWSNEANKLTNWFKVFPQSLQGWPFALFLVNHDRMSLNAQGYPVHHAPGGSAQTYATTTRLLFMPAQDLDRTADGVEGRAVRVKVTKNASAPGGYETKVQFKWRMVLHPDTGELVQQSWWDWDRATTEGLFAICETTGSRAKAMRDLLGLAKATNGRWTCEAVNVSDPVGPDEVGALIAADRPLCDRIDKVAEIRKGIEFEVGRDLLEQCAL